MNTGWDWNEWFLSIMMFLSYLMGIIKERRNR